MKKLAQINPRSIETPVAIGIAAIEAKDYALARRSLESIEALQVTQRVCTLMARLENEEKADKGLAREWLARAVHAPRDPAWVADGVVSDKWAPVSPVTGAFDAFQWRVPADALDTTDKDLLAAKLDELVKLAAPAADVAKSAPRSSEEENLPLGSADAVSKRGNAGKAETARPASGPSREAVDATVVPATARSGISQEPGKPASGGVVTGSGLAARAATGDSGTRSEGKIGEVKPADATPELVDVSAHKPPLEPGMFIVPKAAEGGAVGDKAPEERGASRAAVSG